MRDATKRAPFPIWGAPTLLYFRRPWLYCLELSQEEDPRSSGAAETIQGKPGCGWLLPKNLIYMLYLRFDDLVTHYYHAARGIDTYVHEIRELMARVCRV